MDTNNRFEFLGVRINATNLSETSQFMRKYDYSRAGYISFPDSSVVATARHNPALQEVLNNAVLTLPDGKPSELYAKSRGFKKVSTVSGYWLCKDLLTTPLTHYFLGSTPEKLAKIKALVEKEYPKARVLGYHSPPFREATFFESGQLLDEALEEINQLKPDLIWVGLSSPKQDFLAKYHVKALRHGLLMGVGGVFDYLSGDVQKSPEWVKKIGMRWLWRLAKEPRRLGSKYWMTIRVFASAIAGR